jgi:SAM-dependent methyltransferase
MPNNPDGAWEQWGSRDPYYGVLTDERYRKNNLSPEVLEEFFLSGEKHIQKILHNVRSHIDANFSPRRAIDFGCGTGRLVVPLARICEKVVGLDTSESMLAETRKNCESRSLTNVELVKSDDELTRLTGQYDFIHSVIVFQHIPISRGERIVVNLLKHLSPAGVGVLHFGFYTNASSASKAISRARGYIPLMHCMLNIIQGKKFNEAKMQMNPYDLNQLFFILQENGADKIYCEFTYDPCHRGVLLYFQKK